LVKLTELMFDKDILRIEEKIGKEKHYKILLKKVAEIEEEMQKIIKKKNIQELNEMLEQLDIAHENLARYIAYSFFVEAYKLGQGTF